MITEENVKDCFASAVKDEEKGKKHKGLLFTKPNVEESKSYIAKAKENLGFCEIYKQMGADYKIPEEWFYALYYCALAILAKFGVESRSQRCTALFLRHVREKGIIEYDREFIDRITVHKEKEKESDVDEREKARYGSWMKSEEVRQKYDQMMNLCRKAIAQCEEIVFSDKPIKVPEELLKLE
ncbi:MAG: hypothetical protein KJ718_01115 [Nanoarchaeota archaeon]|nr:hypothetical protein [Nanoarchaeota archaeon]MBU1051133.1 hypothetical protein [Nanoarchaeota archaeon]MBU1987935.1 hypothetical protein [Nanoarchaeota archaeon]